MVVFLPDSVGLDGASRAWWLSGGPSAECVLGHLCPPQRLCLQACFSHAGVQLEPRKCRSVPLSLAAPRTPAFCGQVRIVCVLNRILARQEKGWARPSFFLRALCLPGLPVLGCDWTAEPGAGQAASSLRCARRHTLGAMFEGTESVFKITWEAQRGNKGWACLVNRQGWGRPVAQSVERLALAFGPGS